MPNTRDCRECRLCAIGLPTLFPFLSIPVACPKISCLDMLGRYVAILFRTRYPSAKKKNSLFNEFLRSSNSFKTFFYRLSLPVIGRLSRSGMRFLSKFNSISRTALTDRRWRAVTSLHACINWLLSKWPLKTDAVDVIDSSSSSSAFIMIHVVRDPLQSLPGKYPSTWIRWVTVPTEHFSDLVY